MRRLALLFGLLGALQTSAFAKPVVVLIPGSGSSGEKISLKGVDWIIPLLGGNQYFGRYKRELKKLGIDHFVCPRMEDDDVRTIEERVDDCATAILLDRGLCSGKVPRDVLLVGHSMGGLVARELAQDPRVEGCIHSVTMISTPNRGTPIGDWAIEHGRDDHGFDIFGVIVRLIGFVPEQRHYLQQMRSNRTGLDPALFHAQDVADNPAVAYYSITDSMETIPNPILDTSRKIIAEEMVKLGLDGTAYGTRNDGIVPEFSMVHGTVLGHLDTYHWATACVDPVKTTRECKSAGKFLFKHLINILP